MIIMDYILRKFERDAYNNKEFEIKCSNCYTKIDFMINDLNDVTAGYELICPKCKKKYIFHELSVLKQFEKNK